MESELPKDASRYKIKALIENYINDEITSYAERKSGSKKKQTIKRFSPFEGSPLHLFLLDELVALDKLDVLGLPDDFKYKNEPFYKYYQDHFVKEINKFRVNKLFRYECNKRLKLAKEIAKDVIKSENAEKYCDIVESDGSFLFNLILKEFFSYQDLEKFTKSLAEFRGIAVLPYQTGFLRFSLGGYIEGSEQSYEVFAKEFENSLRIVLKYWKSYHAAKSEPDNKEKRSDDILEKILKTSSDIDFVDKVLEDYSIIKNLKVVSKNSLTISNIMRLYHAFPKESGITINTIRGSKNSVFEFYENVGSCSDLKSFIGSKAFTIIYENLLPQIYKNIPSIKNLDFNSVIAKYGKATILKYVSNKIDFQPNSYVLDDPDEKNIMTEILIEMEKLLFSDAKVKILALDATNDLAGDKAKLEGTNRILRKYIEELLLHFNLPFALEGIEPTISEVVDKTIEKFEEVIGKSVNEFNLVNEVEELSATLGKEITLNNDKYAFTGYLKKSCSDFVLNDELSNSQKLLRLYLLQNGNEFKGQLKNKVDLLNATVDSIANDEAKMINEKFISKIIYNELNVITNNILDKKNFKITKESLHPVVREIVLFFIEIINKTKFTEYYEKYNHILIKLVETSFRRQNSCINEMIQHGITIHKGFKMIAESDGALDWVNEVMTKCGVIGIEQTVQTRTRIVTDAKKRIYPFHKADRIDESTEVRDFTEPHEFIKSMDIKPGSAFFSKRMAKFVENMDENDYRLYHPKELYKIFDG